MAFSTDDDGMLLWLSDRSAAATSFAKNFLLHYSGTGNDVNDQPKAYTAAGLKTVYDGADAARLIGVPVGDPRVPDLIGIAQHGVVYTGGTSKIAEHGGDDPQDRNVPLVVSNAAGHGRGQVVAGTVQTTEIAPTILALLGLNPWSLQAVRSQHTPVLPHLAWFE